MTGEQSYVGKSIGNYQIVAAIGRGASGSVYRGVHTILTERTVAIKILHTHLDSTEERHHFLQEARLLEHLQHPHILHIFDVGINEGMPYLVAEYAPNGSLRDLIKQRASGILPLQMSLTILSQVGLALSYAHQQNVIHRDLKPENILFNAQNEALLADFGVATILPTSSVKQSVIVGTPAYMAPEYFQGVVSKEGDQYALGCIAYELFTGQAPFTAPDFFALGFKHLTDQPITPTQLNAELPLHIEAAILKAMAKQRTDRHANIQAFIDALYDSYYSTDIEEQVVTTVVTHPSNRADVGHSPRLPPSAISPTLNRVSISMRKRKNSRRGGWGFAVLTGIVAAIVLIVALLFAFPAIFSHSPAASFTPVPTHNATPHSKPMPHLTPGLTPTSVPVVETLSVLFNIATRSGLPGVQTQHSFSGTVLITVSGTGHVSPKENSDAFYVYNDLFGKPLSPPNATSCWVLYINGQHASLLAGLPAYNGTHVYKFSITLNQPGPITFGVCDGRAADNSGGYTITVQQK